MTDKDRRCANCMYFRQDYNDDIAERELKEMEMGYCMCDAPKPVVITTRINLDDDDPTSFVVWPLVSERASCSKFEPREFPCVHYCFESNQQENDK